MSIRTLVVILAILALPALSVPVRAQEPDCPAGWEAFSRRDFGTAEEELARCLGQRPDDALLLVLRGLCRNQLGRYDLAIEDYERARRADPERAELYLLPGAFLPTNRVFWGTERAAGGYPFGFETATEE